MQIIKSTASRLLVGETSDVPSGKAYVNLPGKHYSSLSFSLFLPLFVGFYSRDSPRLRRRPQLPRKIIFFSHSSPYISLSLTLSLFSPTPAADVKI